MMNSDEIIYSQEGKQSGGLHKPFICPFCGPKQGAVANDDYLNVIIDYGVTIRNDSEKTIQATIVYCSKCLSVLSIIPD